MAAIDVAAIKANYILINHTHCDHVIDVALFAKKGQSAILVHHEIVPYYNKLGIKGHAMNPGGSFPFPLGTVKVVHAIHSSVFPDGTYGGNPYGFIIESNDKTIYIKQCTFRRTYAAYQVHFFKDIHFRSLMHE